MLLIGEKIIWHQNLLERAVKLFKQNEHKLNTNA